MENTTELINLIHKVHKELHKTEMLKEQLEQQLKFLNDMYEEVQKKEENNYKLEQILIFHGLKASEVL